MILRRIRGALAAPLIGVAAGCTEPAAEPLSGTFAVDGRFSTHVMTNSVTVAGGVTQTHDTTAVDSPVAGKITFGQLTESVDPAEVKVSLAHCPYCLGPTAFFGKGFRIGDSIKVLVGVDPTTINPSYQLLGVYLGDSIVGRIESTASGSGPNGSYVRKAWGNLVARRSQPDPTLTFTFRGLFDSLTATNSQGVVTTRTGASDSIRGPLKIDDITTAPIATLTVEKCGPACFGRTVAAPAAYNGHTGGGRRNGDSVTFTMLWDLMSRVEIRGIYRGDSIVGAMQSIRSTSTSTIYTGSFVARRVSP